MNDPSKNITVEASTVAQAPNDLSEEAVKEDFILSMQDHWIWLLRPVFFLICGVILTIVVFSIGMTSRTFSFQIQYFLYMLAFVIASISLHVFFLLILQWLVETVLISEKRIIDIKYVPFLVDDMNHISLEKINDVEKNQHGIIKNFLNYGEIHMSVSGMHTDIHFHYVRMPSKFVNFMQAVKFNKPLDTIDLHGCGATFSKEYKHLRRKK